MRHMVRVAGDVWFVQRFDGTQPFVRLVPDSPEQEYLLLPDEARDLAERLRGVADAITEQQRKAADPRQLSLPLLTVEKGNG